MWRCDLILRRSIPSFLLDKITLSFWQAEQEVLNRNSRKSEELFKKLAGDSSRAEYKDNKSLEAAYQLALTNKNRLLEYDITCEKRTKVIDDEADYFSVDSNKWLTPEQRAALQKKGEELHEGRHQSRLNRRVNLDFAGRRVVEANDEVRYDMNQVGSFSAFCHYYDNYLHSQHI